MSCSVPLNLSDGKGASVRTSNFNMNKEMYPILGGYLFNKRKTPPFFFAS